MNRVTLKRALFDWIQPRLFQQVIHGKYFPHIDGLRCLSVIPVVLYHLKPELCPGGFLGVDIFFVISGYLICGGIIRDLKGGTFTLPDFYCRRIRRIFPAYFVLVLSVLLVGLALFHYGRIIPLAQTSLFSVFFSTNIYFWLDMGYFQPNAHENPLLHLWSLGVEEQFYILVPVASLLLWRWKKRALTSVFALALAGSLALCLFLGDRGNSTTAFYLLPTRAWELLAGALFAFAPPAAASLRSGALSFLGLVLILASFFMLDTSNTFARAGTSVDILVPFFGSLGTHPFPGFVTVPTILGSLLTIRYGATGILAPLLASTPFVGIGKISYSLYLWHWPLIVFGQYVTYGHLTSAGQVTIFLLSFLIAYLSWRWIELPVRLTNYFSPKMAFTSTALGCGSLALLCLVLIHTNGLYDHLHKEANAYAAAPRPFLENIQKFLPKPAFRTFPDQLLDPNYFRLIGMPGQEPTFCLIGDSHARALAPGFDSVAAAHDRTGIYLTLRIFPCAWKGGESNEQNILNWLANNPDISDIYIVCRWLAQYRIYGSIPKLGDKGGIRPLTVEPHLIKEMEVDLRYTAGWFKKHGKRVFVFTTVPEYEYGPADLLARRQIIPMHYPIEITREDYLNRQAPIDRIFERLESEDLLSVIPLGSALLSGNESVLCGPSGEPYYNDANHLSPAGAIFVSEKIAPLLWGRTLPQKTME